jgi:hypothetical protein
MSGNSSRSAVAGVVPKAEEPDDKMEAIKSGNLGGLTDTDVPEDEELDDEMDATEWGNLGRLTETDVLPEDELPDDKMNAIELENLDGLVDTDAVPEDEEPDDKMVWGIYFDRNEIDAWEPGKSSGAADTNVIPENQDPCDETTWANHFNRSAMDDIELGDSRSSADTNLISEAGEPNVQLGYHSYNELGLADPFGGSEIHAVEPGNSSAAVDTDVPEDEEPDNETEWENNFDRDEMEFIEYISCSASADMVVISKVRNSHFQLRIDKWGIPVPFDRSEMDSMRLGNASGAAGTDVIRGFEDSEDEILCDAESTYCTIGGMNHHEDDEEIQPLVGNFECLLPIKTDIKYLQGHTFLSEDELHTALSSVLEQDTVDLPETSPPSVTSPRGDNSILTKHRGFRDGAILTDTMISHEPIEEEYILLSLASKSIHADDASISPSLSITISQKNPDCDSLAKTRAAK